VILLVALVAGCGGGSSSTSGGTSGGSEGDGSSSDYLSQVEANVETLLSPMGTFKEEPTTSPIKAGEGRKIEVISCGQQVVTCAEATAGAMEAAKKLGWQATLFDAKLDYPSAATGIRQAVANGVEGIFIYFMDCSNFKSALEEAKKAGVFVVAADARDCSETNPGAPSLLDYIIHYAGNADYDTYQEEYFHAIGEYMMAKTGGESKAQFVGEETPTGQLSEASLKELYAKCSGCSLEFVKYPGSAFGTRLQGIAEQELLKHPEVNSVIPGYEAVSLEVYPAVRASGRSSEIITFLGEGAEASINLLREGANGVATSTPVEWEGYAGVDALGRVMLGQKPVPMGQGVRLVDAEHNMPKSGPAGSPVDFKAMYEKAWGLK